MELRRTKFRITFGLWPRLILLTVAIALLGIGPRPHAFRQSLEQAARSLEGGAPEYAAQSVAQAANLLPWRADLWEKAGLYALQAGDAPQAAEYLKQAWRVDRALGLTHAGWLALGDAYRDVDNLPQAIRAWTAGMGRYGPSVELLDRLWKAHLASGSYAAAGTNLKALLLKSPHDAQLHYTTGLVMTLQQPEDGLKYLEEAARLDPRYQTAAGDLRRALLSARTVDDRAYTLIAAGRALAALGEWDLAAETFRQAVLARPDYAEGWAYLGEARQHSGSGSLTLPHTSTSDGLAELKIALQRDPKSLSARTFLALYWARKANYDRAVETIREAVALDPKNPAMQVQYASIQAASGDLAGAHDAYLRAIDLSPYDPTYRRYLIEFSLEYDYELERLALPMARQLVARYPDGPENLDLMGRVLVEMEDLDSAERFFVRAIAQDPQYAAAHMHLGLIHALRGEREQALEELDLAIALASGTPTAAQAQRLLEIYFP